MRTSTRIACDLLKNRSEHLFVCAQVLTEFWVVATRPREGNGMGLEFCDAVAELANVRTAFPRLVEPADIADRWQQVVAQHCVMGKQAHDARIVALMMAHGIASILTINASDFARYKAVTPVLPGECLSETM